MAIVVPVLQVIFLFDNTTSGQYNLLMVLVPGRLSLAGFLDKTKQNKQTHTRTHQNALISNTLPTPVNQTRD